MVRWLFFSLPVFFLLSCGSTEEEKSAAEIACSCSQDKSVFGIANCFASVADSLDVDPASIGYDRAFRKQCPETYDRLMDFSKGKK